MSDRRLAFLELVRPAGAAGVVLTRNQIAKILGCGRSTAGRIPLDLARAGAITREMVHYDDGGCAGVRYRLSAMQVA